MNEMEMDDLNLDEYPELRSSYVPSFADAYFSSGNSPEEVLHVSKDAVLNNLQLRGGL